MTTQPINLPAPYAGQNSKTPIAALESPYCETLFNFNTTDAGVELRNGDSKWCSKTYNATGGVTTEGFAGFVNYDSATQFMAVYTLAGGPTYGMRFYNISTEGAAPTLAYTSVVAATTTSEIFTTYFAGRVYVYRADTSAGDYYDGAAWGSIGYTFPTISPLGGTAYKNRQYFIGGANTKYGYSGIDAVTGTVTEVDLGGVIREKSNLAVIHLITISDNISSVTLLAFVFFSGEVLFYSGRYPDADEWALVGRAEMGQVLNYNAVISYQGDGLVMCRTGLVSLRDLFLKGAQAALSLTVSDNINTDWTTLVSAIVTAGGSNYNSANGRLLYVSGCWWKIKNRIVISFPVHLVAGSPVSSGGNTYFVLDTLRGGWAVQQSNGVFLERQITTFKDAVLFSTGTVAESTTKMVIGKKEGATGFLDANTDDTGSIAYDFTIQSAPLPVSKTGITLLKGLELICQSDLYATTNITGIGDLGSVQTDAEEITADSALDRQYADISLDGCTYVQYKVSGTTVTGKTVGLDLYGINAWLAPGVGRFR